jgi:hypothetical protein
MNSMSVPVTNRVVPDSGQMGTSSLSPGSYSFNAIYTGDPNNNGATSPCEPFTIISMASPTIATVIKNSAGLPITSVAVGNPVHDTATLSGATNTAGGSVNYNLFNNGACSGTPLRSMSVTVTNSVVPDSGQMGTSSLSLGSYSFNANYGGDVHNNLAVSPCELFTVVTAGTVSIATVIKDSSGSPVTSVLVGNPVHDTATLSAATSGAGGSVNYNLFNNGGCSGAPLNSMSVPVTNSVVPDSGGMGTASLLPGSYSFNAMYTGDANNNVASSSCEPFTVDKASPTIATTLFVNSVVVGSLVTDSVTFVGVTSSAGGTVTYEYFTGSACMGPSTPVGVPTNVRNGAAAISTSQTFNAAGSYSWNALYSGDASNSAATSACEPLIVNKAASSTSTGVENAATNQPLSGAEVTGASFYDTAALRGFVSIATLIKDSSGSPVTSVVAGNPVHDTAILSGATNTAGGSVNYNLFNNGGCSGAPLNSMSVPVTNRVVPDSGQMGTSSLSPGSYSFNAIYTGDANNNGATGPCEAFTVISSTSVSIATLIKDSSGSPATSVVVGNPVHDTATLSGVTSAAGGSVNYHLFANGGCSGTPLNSMSVSVTNGVVADSGQMGTASLSPGSYGFNAMYTGDPKNSGATSSCEPFAVVLAGVSVPLPTGTLFYNLFASGGCTGTPHTSQSVTLTVSGAVPNSMATGALGGGLYSFSTTYIGDSNHLASTSDCEPFSVNPANTVTTTALFTSLGVSIPVSGSVPLGTSVYDTASVGPGVVTFQISGTVHYLFASGGSCGVSTSGITVGLGAPSMTVGPLGAGTYSFVAIYSGDSNYSGSTSSCETFTVLKAATTIQTQLYVDLSTYTIWNTATITYSPLVATGNVIYNIYAGSGCAGTPISTQSVAMANGFAPNSAATSSLKVPGSYSFQAVYNGDSNYFGSTSTCYSIGFGYGR